MNIKQVLRKITLFFVISLVTTTPQGHCALKAPEVILHNNHTYSSPEYAQMATSVLPIALNWLGQYYKILGHNNKAKLAVLADDLVHVIDGGLSLYNFHNDSPTLTLSWLTYHSSHFITKLIEFISKKPVFNTLNNITNVNDASEDDKLLLTQMFITQEEHKKLLTTMHSIEKFVSPALDAGCSLYRVINNGQTAEQQLYRTRAEAISSLSRLTSMYFDTNEGSIESKVTLIALMLNIIISMPNFFSRAPVIVEPTPARVEPAQRLC